MRATLESRKSVRLNWFRQENVPFIIQREINCSYSVDSVITNETSYGINMHYVFSKLTNPIPATNIIIFEKELPQTYMKTQGSVGDKLLTELTSDSDIECMDRIVKLDQGTEKISMKPVLPHEVHIYKEIQIHERTDKIWRKITLKNKTSQAIKNIIFNFVENKEVRFVEAKPVPTNKDAPEYKWELEIPADGTVNIELTLESFLKITYKIEKEKLPSKQVQSNSNI